MGATAVAGILIDVELRMGCAPDVPLQRLQALLGLLYERHVALEVEVTYLPTAPQLKRLREGDLDLGLIHDTALPSGVESEGLYRGEALAAVVSLAHRVAARETARHQDLAGDVLFVVPRQTEPGFHDRVVTLAQSDGFAFRHIREAPGPDMRDLLFAVASGHGVTIAPRSALSTAGDVGAAAAARSLTPPSWMPDTCLAWPVNARSELTDVYAAAHEVARELYRP
jgi:hypothetical protein